MSLKNGGRIKRQETRIYEAEFDQYLIKYSNEITIFLKEFDKESMGIYVHYEFYFPQTLFFTKKNKLNRSKLPDVDNLIKVTQDLIFSRIVDDAYVVELTARKLPTNQDAFIKAEIQSVELPKIY